VLPRSPTLALAALVLVPGPQTPPRTRPAITVSAAISLTDVLSDLAKAYAAQGGGPVIFNFAGSNTLSRQILNGAPADLFVSADDAQMDVVERAGGLAPGTRAVLVANVLAIATAPDRAAFIRDNFNRAPPEIRRLAIGDPAAVPAGVYARQYLEMKGLWKAYESRVVPTANVRAALVAVESGSADAAIVYATDLASARSAVAAFVVPQDQGPRIVYPAAIVASSRNPAEAARFLSFLRGAEAAAIFERYKFLPVRPSARRATAAMIARR
jgi:molybdate transport system substrate-binding protein